MFVEIISIDTRVYIAGKAITGHLIRPMSPPLLGLDPPYVSRSVGFEEVMSVTAIYCNGAGEVRFYIFC